MPSDDAFLFVNDLEDFHRAGLCADTAGDALGCVFDVGGLCHCLSGADIDALAASDTLFLVDHVNARLLILLDSFMLTDVHTLAALETYEGLNGTVLLGADPDVGESDVESLVVGLSAGGSACETCHALGSIGNN